MARSVAARSELKRQIEEALHRFERFQLAEVQAGSGLMRSTIPNLGGRHPDESQDPYAAACKGRAGRRLSFTSSIGGQVSGDRRATAFASR